MTHSLLYFASVDFNQLRKQARELLAAYRAGQAQARQWFAKHHPNPPAAVAAKLADAQWVMARLYDYPSWSRFRMAGQLVNAIRGDDVASVLELINKHPKLLTENVFGRHSNWGPPLSVAAQMDVPQVFNALMAIEGQDLDHAFGRAALQGRTEVARRLFDRGANIAADEVMGPCETLNPEGLRLLVECGAPFQDETGNRYGPVGLLLQGYYRNPHGKHACLEYCVEIGIELPDTPLVAFHRGRLDMLERHLRRDPGLIDRRFQHHDIYPLELGCDEDQSLALHGTPVAGATLLHLAMDFDEAEIAQWLLERGADCNALALLDKDGFGGHTPLYNLVVSQAYRSGRQRNGALVRLLLEHGAHLNPTASIRKGIRFVEDESVHEYRDVTPLQYGREFHQRAWVSEPAMTIISDSGAV